LPKKKTEPDIATPAKKDTKSVEVPKVTPPVPEPVADPPKPSGPPPLANTPITPIPWRGARRGTANWAGTLDPGSRLVLGSNGVLEGGGVLTVTGGSLPTQDMNITSLFPDLQLQTLPATRLQRVVIVNNSGSPVNNVRFSWAIK
jgi:hypothetical protein